MIKLVSKTALYRIPDSKLIELPNVLAGYRYTDGAVSGRGAYAYFWSSSDSGTSAWKRYLNSSYASVYRYTSSKAYGFSAIYEIPEDFAVPQDCNEFSWECKRYMHRPELAKWREAMDWKGESGKGNNESECE